MDGSEEIIKSKLVSTLRKGDRIVIATAGGGGYGSPLGRDPSLLQADLQNGKVSLEAAREHYGYRGNV
jgi:N-methylhydantoinase B